MLGKEQDQAPKFLGIQTKGSGNLSKRILKKQCQFDFDNGLSRKEIFQKHSENEVSEPNLAIIVSGLKDSSLIKKYKVLNHLLVGIMGLFALLMIFSFYEMSKPEEVTTSAVMALIAVLFVTLIYGIHRNYHQAYLIYALLTTMKLPTHIDGFGNDLTVNIIELGLALFIVCTTWFLKFKLFPYMSLSGGAKKSDDGKYLVAMNS